MAVPSAGTGAARKRAAQRMLALGFNFFRAGKARLKKIGALVKMSQAPALKSPGRVFAQVLAALIMAAVANGASAQPPKMLSDKKISPQEFVQSNRDFADLSARLRKEAIAEYELAKPDIESAEEKFWYAKFFEYLEASKVKPPDNFLEFFVNDAELTLEFSQIVAPEDKLDEVLKILCRIYEACGEDFSKFPRLACAIAIVFDSQPPKTWPHAQVSEDALKRSFPDPVEAFKTRVDSRKRGKALIQTEKLSIEELKYLVSSLASESDREWVFKSVPFTVNTVAKLYSSIDYRTDRVNSKQYQWVGTDYSLKNIKDTGGICVDQAYYTAEAAKIRGMPAFVFSGAGSDGFHAWTACMQKSGKWNFDIGRYEGARFVTGKTLDPQTWKPASDHALNAMREAFRNSPKYRSNLLHTAFAKNYLDEKNFGKAARAAKAAIAADSRNGDSWEYLIDALESSGAEQEQIVQTYKDAIRAFGRYPDIEAAYRRRLMDVLEKTDPQQARKISAQMISKTKRSRPDIAMEFARRELEADIASDNLDKFQTNYKMLLSSFKGDQGIAVIGITIPILNKLLNSGNPDKCDAVMKVTRQVFKSSKDSTLTATLASIEEQLDQIKKKLKSN